MLCTQRLLALQHDKEVPCMPMPTSYVWKRSCILAFAAECKPFTCFNTRATVWASAAAATAMCAAGHGDRRFRRTQLPGTQCGSHMSPAADQSRCAFASALDEILAVAVQHCAHETRPSLANPRAPDL